MNLPRLRQQILNANVVDGTNWERVDVSVPTLMMPTRNDALLAEPLFAGGVLGNLRILYTPEQPLRDPPNNEAVLALASVRGACWLWAPGQWWVSVRTDSNGGAGWNGRMPFEMIACPDRTFLDAYMMGRSQRRAPRNRKFTIVGGTSGIVLTVQQQLEGLKALELKSSQANAVFYRWGADVDVGNSLYSVSSSSNLLFTGPTLPLSDLYLRYNAGAGNTDVTLAEYY